MEYPKKISSNRAIRMVQWLIIVPTNLPMRISITTGMKYSGGSETSLIIERSGMRAQGRSEALETEAQSLISVKNAEAGAAVAPLVLISSSATASCRIIQDRSMSIVHQWKRMGHPIVDHLMNIILRNAKAR